MSAEASEMVTVPRAELDALKAEAIFHLLDEPDPALADPFAQTG